MKKTAKKALTKKQIFKRVVCFVLAFILLFSGFSMLGSAVIFRVLFHRTGPVTQYVEIPYSRIDQIKYKRTPLSFVCEGATLNGYLYRGGEKGLVIVAQGVNSDCDTHLPEIMRFVDSGYCVMTYDPTGVCSSGGAGTVGLQQSKLDLLAAYDYARSDSALKDMDVFFYGHSLGGYAAAAACDEAEISGAVCVSGFNEPVGTMHSLARRYVGVLADIEYPFLYLENVFMFGGSANETAVDSINSSSAPVLIFQGSADDKITSDLSLYSAGELITNPKAELISIDEPYRNGHSRLWLSENAAEYVSECQQRLDGLVKGGSAQPGSEELKSFYEGVDAEKATECDREYIEKILSFFEKNTIRRGVSR